jgi:tetratricopeptide (TPR) repeat protein
MRMTLDADRQPKLGWRRAVVLGLLAGLTLAGCVKLFGDKDGDAANGQDGLESPLGSYLAGRYARANRDTGAAVDFFETALTEDPDNVALRQRTFLLMLADGKVARALELAPSLTADAQDAAMADVLLATEDARAGHLKRAIQQLGEPNDRGFGALLKPLFLAWLEAGLGNVEAAERRLDQLSDRDAFVPFRDFHAALILDYLGAKKVARNAYESFREKNGTSVSLALAYGAFLRRQGYDAQAEAVYRELLDSSSGNPAVAQALASLKAGDPARPYIEDVKDGIAEALFGAGGALARERGGDAARIYVHIALHLKPEFDSALILLGEILDLDKRWAEAIDVYRRIPKGSPYYWDARIRIATNLNRIDKVDEAVRELESIAGEHPKDIEAVVALADLLRTRERYADAVKAYDRALAMVDKPQERYWALFYSRGVALERSKKWDLAEADFLRALELKPEQPLVLNYLGYSWVEQGRNFDRALQMIEKAVAQRPNDGYIVDSLGWALYRMRDYDGAVKYLERAVELKPEDPVINDHLGDAYWRNGRRLEARFQWRHSLGLEPEKDDIDKIKAKLEKGLAGLASADARH